MFASKMGLIFSLVLSGCAIKRVTEVVAVPASTEPAQMHIMHLNLNNPVTIFNFLAKTCIGESPDHSAVTMPCFNGHEQPMLIKENSGGENPTYLISNRISGRCLEIIDESRNNGSFAGFGRCVAGNENQQFSMVRSNEDPLFVQIMSVHSKKCLDLFQQNIADGTKIHQWDCHIGRSQRFYFNETLEPKFVLNRTIWTFWDKGENNMPAFHRANVNHWRKILKKFQAKGKVAWDVKVINLVKGDPYYFGNFFDPNLIPTIDEIKSKIGSDDGKKVNPYVITSDFIRLELLYKHGGVWMDPSIMLHRSLDDLEEIVENLGHFKVLGYTSFSQATKALRFADSLENFFLVAAPESELLQKWRTNFRHYWDLKTPNLSIENHPMYNGDEDGVKVDTSNFGDLRNYLNQHLALKYTLTKNSDLVRDIYVVGDAGLSEQGPFSLLGLFDWSDERLCQLDPKNFPGIADALKNVKISKFPSDNSKYILQKFTDINDFDRDDNIFGYLNRHL